MVLYRTPLPDPQIWGFGPPNFDVFYPPVSLEIVLELTPKNHPQNPQILTFFWVYPPKTSKFDVFLMFLPPHFWTPHLPRNCAGNDPQKTIKF